MEQARHRSCAASAQCAMAGRLPARRGALPETPETLACRGYWRAGVCRQLGLRRLLGNFPLLTQLAQ